MSNETKPLFAPTECASLHNQILQRATQQDHGGIQPSTNTLQACSDAIKARLLPGTQEFLAAITARPIPKHSSNTPSYPSLRHTKNNLVMLYPAKDTAGGLFFLQQQNLASWIDSDLQLPPKTSWLPLATILERWLQMWDTGKITSELRLKPWCELDLQATLEAWNELVDAIEDRLPDPVPPRPSHESLVEQSVAETWAEQSFQHAFITRARRPAFGWVGPGVYKLTSEYLESRHTAEPQDSERRQVIGRKPGDDDDYQSLLSRDLAPTLLFPGRAVESTWRDHSRPSLRDYKGRGSALLANKAGLYLCPDENWSDGVVFSDGRGRENSFTYKGSCPWMPGRPPALLRDVFQMWKILVVNGAWDVRKGGVFGNMAHFHSKTYCSDWHVATSF